MLATALFILALKVEANASAAALEPKPRCSPESVYPGRTLYFVPTHQFATVLERPARRANAIRVLIYGRPQTVDCGLLSRYVPRYRPAYDFGDGTVISR